jgi:hypothetical protein
MYLFVQFKIQKENNGTSVKNKPRGKFHPGMAKGKEGLPSRTQTNKHHDYEPNCVTALL